MLVARMVAAAAAAAGPAGLPLMRLSSSFTAGLVLGLSVERAWGSFVCVVVLDLDMIEGHRSLERAERSVSQSANRDAIAMLTRSRRRVDSSVRWAASARICWGHLSDLTSA